MPGVMLELQKNIEVFSNHSSVSVLTWEHIGFRNVK